MGNLKQQWDLKMALAVLENQTVDADLWSEAVEWLMLYGPPEIKDLLSQASTLATRQEFPELSPLGYTADGEPLYDIKTLAKSLGITVEEATEQLLKKEQKQNIQHLFANDEAMKIQ
jgi:hypothetical protein